MTVGKRREWTDCGGGLKWSNDPTLPADRAADHAAGVYADGPGARAFHSNAPHWALYDAFLAGVRWARENDNAKRTRPF
jgi:hypothetical protein